MILDKIENYHKYEAMVKNLKNGIDFIRISGELPVGRYEFEGGFALVQEGETSPRQEGQFETHRNYIDVQYMAKGSELLEWNALSQMTVTTPYQPERDIEFQKGEGVVMKITEGMFYIMFPEDAHKACCHDNDKTSYRKIVVKCKI